MSYAKGISRSYHWRFFEFPFCLQDEYNFPEAYGFDLKPTKFLSPVIAQLVGGNAQIDEEYEISGDCLGQYREIFLNLWPLVLISATPMSARMT